ncbi:sigma-70 family RNA polymerase sigma factor [Falsiroseomonas selenitidurans]|uniref:Sigma-70 family RNA polymerase sigma factor n=1 Tax=Falsiroseomonas selenitidurans TaxID=2716335 RepID=A0ABX1E766_9PROT|nr:sigma-70 family RNA polymerase sigma factor [Falsiroseomonas selenitidurans]NKC33049.1 sigma-70 family RNA polymerase sigma factor [Falsiroseomonas selenitidurans]
MPNQTTSDAKAFHDQVIALLPRLRVQALALTRNRAAADDLVQDAVANALAAQNSFTPGTNFAAWMHRILRNRFISTLRKQRETTDIEDVPAGAFAVGATHEDRLILKELGQAVNRLPADQREALFMVVLQGMSYEDVAEATGCAVGTAKSRVFRARRQLQTWLTGEESSEATTPEQRAGQGRGQGARGALRNSAKPEGRGTLRSGVGEHHLLP